MGEGIRPYPTRDFILSKVQKPGILLSKSNTVNILLADCG
jgi:hypothetical protein